ncbi:hypothetical protein ISS85_04020 [Candidatus Microgenomates bacterium]|nr:hypothetical protein [Candidatus Microgenomates bacterium]
MNQLKLNYLHLADGASPDQLGKLSIYGIFERVILNKVPGKLLKFVAVGNLKFGKGIGEKINLKIKITDPSKQDLTMKEPITASFPVDAKKNKEGGRIGFVIEIGNLEFKMTGEYQIVVYANKKKVGIKKLIVTKKGVENELHN